MKKIPQNVKTIGNVTFENVEFFGDEEIVIKDSSLKDTKVFGKTTIENSVVCGCNVKESQIINSKVSGREIFNSFVSDSELDACVISGASIENSKLEKSGFSGGKCSNSTLSNFSTYASSSHNSFLTNGFFVYSCCDNVNVKNIGVSESLLSDISLESKTKPSDGNYVVLFKDNKINGNNEALSVVRQQHFSVENNGSMLVVSDPV